MLPAIRLGALAAAAVGRTLLALVYRRFRSRISIRRFVNLAATDKVLMTDRKRASAGLAPVPSVQLFETAGLIGVGRRGLSPLPSLVA